MAHSGFVLIDTTWWTGGNRHRGIGNYLSYFFEYVYQVEVSKRVWLFPASVPAQLVNDFIARFGGVAETINTSTELTRQQTKIEKIITARKIKTILFSSPFERPWSLLDHGNFIFKQKIQTQAIVFDLLPLQFEKEILLTWPEKEQSAYKQKVEYLSKIDSLWAISPQTARMLESLAKVKPERIGILKFGLTTAWLRPPTKGSPISRSNSTKKLASTISGGEWRKNLPATIIYFSQKMSQDHDLGIICKLSLRESLKMRQLALQLDSYPSIKFLGQVSQRDKWRWLYSSDAFLFLSLAEGLGIPLLEARAAGIKRIIISKQLAEQGFAKLVPGCEVVDTTNLTVE